MNLVRPPVEKSFHVVLYVLPDPDNVIVTQFTVLPVVVHIISDASQRQPLELPIELDIDPNLFG